MVRMLVLCALLSGAAVLPSCVAVGSDTQNVHRPTAGQELIDLKSALDKGAITPAEYEQKKAAILAQK